MKLDKANAQMRRGVLELCILSLLAKGDAYTNDLVTALQKSEMIVVEGTIYPMLTRLKNSGYLSYRWEESSQGPPRKYYELTESGRKYLELLTDAWQATVAAVTNLLEQ